MRHTKRFALTLMMAMALTSALPTAACANDAALDPEAEVVEVLEMTEELPEMLEAQIEEEEVPMAAEAVEEGITAEIQALLDAAEGFPQKKSTSGSGLCTSSATALMMKRRQIVDQKPVTFGFYDVRMSLGLSREAALGLKNTQPNWTRAGGFSDIYSGSGTTTYYTAGLHRDQLGATVEERKATVAALLADHPEGIVLYGSTKYGPHALCLTGYDAETDTFYGCDSVDVRDAVDVQGRRPEPLANTYLGKKCGSQDAVFNNLRASSTAGCVWYIANAVYAE